MLPTRDIDDQRILQSDWTKAHILVNHLKVYVRQDEKTLSFHSELFLIWPHQPKINQSTLGKLRLVWTWLGTPAWPHPTSRCCLYAIFPWLIPLYKQSHPLFPSREILMIKEFCILIGWDPTLVQSINVKLLNWSKNTLVNLEVTNLSFWITLETTQRNFW